mmetsp:Transcript_33609/g.92813  ORF Transcript_33609/g.92813 Transcript_33609/m.92813 type:complete len:221 (+) Transcript_33609:1185-1847(+)
MRRLRERWAAEVSAFAGPVESKWILPLLAADVDQHLVVNLPTPWDVHVHGDAAPEGNVTWFERHRGSHVVEPCDHGQLLLVHCALEALCHPLAGIIAQTTCALGAGHLEADHRGGQVFCLRESERVCALKGATLCPKRVGVNALHKNGCLAGERVDHLFDARLTTFAVQGDPCRARSALGLDLQAVEMASDRIIVIRNARIRGESWRTIDDLANATIFHG